MDTALYKTGIKSAIVKNLTLRVTKADSLFIINITQMGDSIFQCWNEPERLAVALSTYPQDCPTAETFTIISQGEAKPVGMWVRRC